MGSSGRGHLIEGVLTLVILLCFAVYNWGKMDGFSEAQEKAAQSPAWVAAVRSDYYAHEALEKLEEDKP